MSYALATTAATGTGLTLKSVVSVSINCLYFVMD